MPNAPDIDGVYLKATVTAGALLVDALSEKAADFYAHNGFRRVPGTMRLVQNLSDIAEALEVD